jgi:thymidine phosphorylase
VVELIGDPRAADVIRSGAALDRFKAMARAHGGDLDAPLRGRGCQELALLAEESGVVSRCDAGGIGRAAFVLGAGRVRADQAVHPGLGLRLLRKPGEPVQRGEALALLYHDRGHGLDEALSAARGAYAVSP